MLSSLNAFRRPDEGTCGPTQKSTKVSRILDRVAGDLRLAGGLLFDQLDLQRLTVFGEEAHRFVARPHLPLVRQVLRGELLHLLFDRLEILRHERPVDDEVVEEPVLGRGTDPALRARKQIGDRGGEQVGGAVTVDVQGLGAAWSG